MKFTYAAAALAFAAGAVAQADECVDTIPYQFSFNTDTVKSKVKRDADCSGSNTLVLSLSNSVLTDKKKRIGSIVANYQFQFDGPPPQAGAIYTKGWCLNSANSTLGIKEGGKLQYVFYNCKSGGFSNIYDRIDDRSSEQCTPVTLDTIRCAGSSAPESVAESATVVPSASSASGPSSSTPVDNFMTEMISMTPSPVPIPTGAPAPAPAPAGNSSAPVGTASPPSPTGSATTSPSPFVGAGAALAAGQKIVVLAAGAAAFALML